jgi:hypothetical protein
MLESGKTVTIETEEMQTQGLDVLKSWRRVTKLGSLCTLPLRLETSTPFTQLNGAAFTAMTVSILLSSCQMWKGNVFRVSAVRIFVIAPSDLAVLGTG